MSVILCCFASQRYWSDKEELKRAFDSVCGKIGGLCEESFLIDDDFDVNVFSIRKNDILIAVPMSGAVQPNVLKVAEMFKSVLIFAGYIKNTFGEGVSEKMLINNEAPAVMDIYAVVKRICNDVNLCTSTDELEKRVKAINVVEKLKTTKLLAIGDTEPWVISAVKDWSYVKERFGIEIVNVSQSELAALYESISADEAQEYASAWQSGAEKIVEPTATDISDASRFQAALIKLIEKYNASGAALACFNLLKTGTTSCLGVSYINTYTDYVVSCEGDMDSAVTMLIMKQLSKNTVWMANPNLQPDKTVNFVHCTAPVAINGEKCKYILRNHHESGIGVSTQVKLPEKKRMTACRISNNMSRMLVQNCTGTHGEYEPSCRTQLKISFEDIDKYIKNPLGCHQIFSFEDIKQELIYVAELVGIEIL